MEAVEKFLKHRGRIERIEAHPDPDDSFASRVAPTVKGVLMSKIELLLRSQLVNDALFVLLDEAGLSVFREPILPNDDTTVISDGDITVIIDFDDCHDLEMIHLHQQRGAKIVVLASEPDSLTMSDDQIAPLSGVLTYELPASAFVQSLRLIGSGERVFPRHLALGVSSPAPSPGTKPQSDGVRLSPREREVLSNVVEGHSNKVVAWRLGMAEATVKVHLKSVLRKIKVDNRTQAAVWALANLPELNATPRGFV